MNLLDEFFDSDGVLTELLEMAHDSLIPEYSRTFLSKEPNAVRIQVFTSSHVPGLLQTEEYARELFRRALISESEEGLDERVALRMRRQRIFEREEPLSYWAIMDEAALKRPMMAAGRMVEQLRHLVRMAARPRVTIQVLPFAKGMHTMLGGSLTLMTLKEGGTIAQVESFDSGEGVHSTSRVVELTERFDLVRSMALTDDDSLDLIRRYLKEYEDELDS